MKKSKLVISVMAGISITACNSGTSTTQPKIQTEHTRTTSSIIDAHNNIMKKANNVGPNGEVIMMAPIEFHHKYPACVAASSMRGISRGPRSALTPWTPTPGHSLIGLSIGTGHIAYVLDTGSRIGTFKTDLGDHDGVNWDGFKESFPGTTAIANNSQFIVGITPTHVFTLNLGTGNVYNLFLNPDTIPVSITYSPFTGKFYVLMRSHDYQYSVFTYIINEDGTLALDAVSRLGFGEYDTIEFTSPHQGDQGPGFSVLNRGLARASGYTQIITSNDGETWNSESTPLDTTIAGVAIGNGIDIAVSEDGTVIQRNKGQWKIIFNFGIPNFEAKSLIFTEYNETTGAGDFILIAEVGGELITFTSEDGINWVNNAVPTFTQVSAGVNTACGISGDGDIYCWGSNEAHILGAQYTAKSITTPVKIQSHYEYKSVSVGADHACALRVGGIVDCWGSNQYGQLGTGGSPDQTTPTQVSGRLTFRNVKVGDNHSCGVANTGFLYCWGNNQYGQTGQNMSVFSVLSPQQVSNIYMVPNPEIGLALGSNHTCFNGLRPRENSTSNVLTYCFGSNTHGQLGIGGKSDVGVNTPRLVSRAFNQIDAGGDSTCGVDVATSNAYCWGLNDRGQVGGGKYAPSEQLIPHPVVDANGKLYTFLRVSVGINHACGVDGGVTPQLLCWGDNTSGELGLGQVGDYYPYASVVPASITQDFAMSLGGQFGVATDANNSYALGRNDLGQLGLNTRNLESTLTQINPD